MTDGVRQSLAVPPSRHVDMGKLLALSLMCTLAGAALYQPALMGPPRGGRGSRPRAATFRQARRNEWLSGSRDAGSIMRCRGSARRPQQEKCDRDQCGGDQGKAREYVDVGQEHCLELHGLLDQRRRLSLRCNRFLIGVRVTPMLHPRRGTLSTALMGRLGGRQRQPATRGNFRQPGGMNGCSGSRDAGSINALPRSARRPQQEKCDRDQCGGNQGKAREYAM